MILIVDDSDIGREVIKKSLMMNGYTELEEAENGAAGLEKAKAHQGNIKLYLLDINMPVMNGLELLEAIRAFDKSTPVVMLTTETDKAKMAKAKEMGATGWIIKPFDGEKLTNVIKIVMKEE